MEAVCFLSMLELILEDEKGSGGRQYGTACAKAQRQESEQGP
jgi:hypothetical protein